MRKYEEMRKYEMEKEIGRISSLGVETGCGGETSQE